jgi:hypothetical protein
MTDVDTSASTFPVEGQKGQGTLKRVRTRGKPYAGMVEFNGHEGLINIRDMFGNGSARLAAMKEGDIFPSLTVIKTDPVTRRFWLKEPGATGHSDRPKPAGNDRGGNRGNDRGGNRGNDRGGKPGNDRGGNHGNNRGPRPERPAGGGRDSGRGGNGNSGPARDPRNGQKNKKRTERRGNLQASPYLALGGKPPALVAPPAVVRNQEPEIRLVTEAALDAAAALGPQGAVILFVADTTTETVRKGDPNAVRAKRLDAFLAANQGKFLVGRVECSTLEVVRFSFRFQDGFVQGTATHAAMGSDKAARTSYKARSRYLLKIVGKSADGKSVVVRRKEPDEVVETAAS